jgi:hypothetical protein
MENQKEAVVARQPIIPIRREIRVRMNMPGTRSWRRSTISTTKNALRLEKHMTIYRMTETRK